MDSELTSREILWNLNSSTDYRHLLALTIFSLTICLAGILHRLVYWLPDSDQRKTLFFALFEQIYSFLRTIWERVSTQTPSRKTRLSLGHFLLVLSLAILTITSIAVMLAFDYHLKSFQGLPYLILSLSSELAGVIVLISILFYLQKSRKSSHREWSRLLPLFALLILVVQGFLLEALRISVAGEVAPFFSPVGVSLSLLFDGVNQGFLQNIHYFTWWAHAALTLLLIATSPWTSLIHIFAVPISRLVQTTKEPGWINFPGDLDVLLETTPESIEELPLGWKSPSLSVSAMRLSKDACVKCNRCLENCPAHLHNELFSLRNLFNGPVAKNLSSCKQASPWSLLRQNFREKIPHRLGLYLSLSSSAITRLVQNSASCTSKPFRQQAPEVEHSQQEIPSFYWSCTTCLACREVCPASLDPVGLVIEQRRQITLMKGNPPTEVGRVLRALQAKGQPFPGITSFSTKAKPGNDLPNIPPGGKTEYLLWLGCLLETDPALSPQVTAISRLLNAANCSWATVGGTKCCGEPARKLGEELLFQTLAKHNYEILSAIEFKTLITPCPHCMHTLNHSYSILQKEPRKKKFIVMPLTQLLNQFLQSGKLSLLPNFSGTIQRRNAFHDPCYLARYAGDTESPRELLRHCFGTNLVELPTSGKHTTCCGGGGGNFFLDKSPKNLAVSTQRLHHASLAHCSQLTTACSFCYRMLKDAQLSLTPNDLPQTQVIDIYSLLADCLK